MASVLGFKRIYSTYYDIDSIADTIKDALDGNIFQLVHSFAFPCDNTFSFYTAVIASRFVRNFSEKSHSNQAAFCSFSKSIFCSRRVSALM